MSNRAGHAQTRFNSYWRNRAVIGRLRRLRIVDHADTRPECLAEHQSVDYDGERFRYARRQSTIPGSRRDLNAAIDCESATGNAVCGANHGAGCEAVARIRDVYEVETGRDVLLGRDDRVSFAHADAIGVADDIGEPIVGGAQTDADTVAGHREQLREQLAIRRRSARELTRASNLGALGGCHSSSS